MSDRNEAVKEAAMRLGVDLPAVGVTVELTIRLHDNGALSVSGPIGDKQFCKKLLEEGWEAIKRNHHSPDAIVTPACDVESVPKEAYR